MAPEIRICQGCETPLPADAHGSRRWCSDRCRRHTLYSGLCADCGKTTYNGGTKKPPERCSPCSNRARNTIWTAEAIVQTIQAWVRENGVPPVAADWNPNHAINKDHPEKAEKFFEDNAWPHTSTVQDVFGSWNAAIDAAGFEPVPVGVYAADWYEAA